MAQNARTKKEIKGIKGEVTIKNQNGSKESKDQKPRIFVGITFLSLEDQSGSRQTTGISVLNSLMAAAFS
jgi:hypothetical protein